MKLPKGISGEELAKILTRCGYRVTRQTGSHIRLTLSTAEGEHHITIPRHRNLKIGTLSGILRDVATALRRSKKELIEELFG